MPNTVFSEPNPLEREVAVLRAIVDVAPVMLYQWVLSARGEARFTFVSKGCEQIYEVTSAQMMADLRYSMDVVHPEDRPRFDQAVAVSARDLTPFDWEGRVVLPRRTKWLRAHSVPTRLADGGTRWEGVILDITEQRLADEARRESEQARSALVEQLQQQNALLSRQAEALRQLGTPILPLAQNVIALPLIGDIEPSRAEQLLQVLLDGVTAHQARVAIIDVTGVRTLGTFGAASLLRAARATRLLGAIPVLTGLRPPVAQELVELGVELQGLEVLGSLQDGIAFALQWARGQRPR